MTRKHFEAIAKAIAAAPADKAQAVRELAALLATTNPRFDRARFIEACKPALED